MTALLLVLFGGAAFLAVGSLAITTRNYADAALAIGRQLDNCMTRNSLRQGKHRIHSRRRKAQLSGRTTARRGSAEGGVRKIDRRRQLGYGMVLLPDSLVHE